MTYLLLLLLLLTINHIIIVKGFLDQNLALSWIYNNAHTFGGDKNNITIAGQSAGAWSVGFHLFYEKSWPYFRNAILQSGGPTGSSNLNLFIQSKLTLYLQSLSIRQLLHTCIFC